MIRSIQRSRIISLLSSHSHFHHYHPPRGWMLLFFIIVMILFEYDTTVVQACMLHGTDSGICTTRYLPETYGGGLQGMELASQQWKLGTDGPCKDGEADHCMPFCGKWIANYYPPCVPAPMTLPKDQDYPNGRFTLHTIREKDRWVEHKVKSIIESRIRIETNRTAKRKGVDEYGILGRQTAIHFDKNRDCQLAYERYFCWLNFPRCDEFQESLPMCTSACENFFRVCHYDAELYRCNSKGEIEGRRHSHPNNNNEEMEKDMHQSFFPGQPFKTNQLQTNSKGGEPKDVCTPSIKGAANTRLNHVQNGFMILVTTGVMWVTMLD